MCQSAAEGVAIRELQINEQLPPTLPRYEPIPRLLDAIQEATKELGFPHRRTKKGRQTMKMTRVLVLLLVACASSITGVSHAQLPEASSAHSAQSVIQSAQNAVDQLITNAFDRFDLSVLFAAMEARAVINAIGLQIQDATTTTIDELDGQQRRLVSDLSTLSSSIAREMTQVSRPLNTEVNRALSDIRLLLSDNPGAIHVFAKPAVIGDAHLDILLTGTALTNADLHEFRISTIDFDPTVPIVDDRTLVLRVDMHELISEGLVDDKMDEPLKLNVAFSLKDQSFWTIFSPDTRPLATEAIILPASLGRVRAVFSAITEQEERRAQLRGPFDSARVKTRFKFFDWLIGRRSDVWVATPSHGWRIDLSTAKFDFKELFGACSSRRSYGSWLEQSEHILRVKAHTVAERAIGKTCKTRTTIHFEEWLPTRTIGRVITDFVKLPARETVMLRLPDIHSGARLSHIEIQSPMFQDETKTFRLHQLPAWFSADYDLAGQTVFLTANYNR